VERPAALPQSKARLIRPSSLARYTTPVLAIEIPASLNFFAMSRHTSGVLIWIGTCTLNTATDVIWSVLRTPIASSVEYFLSEYPASPSVSGPGFVGAGWAGAPSSAPSLGRAPRSGTTMPARAALLIASRRVTFLSSMGVGLWG